MFIINYLAYLHDGGRWKSLVYKLPNDKNFVMISTKINLLILIAGAQDRPGDS